ncbi:MAG: class I tRNA ligase family protein, partial [Calditrichaeota bacterium]|nr:class I tRNA ligase family protein [Calditrichota bacterium]
YDIIFFWVARMIVAGMEFLNDVPYRDVYITGMIKDEQGRWMSKSLGNGIDPRDMVDQYGSDAVRYTLIALASEGQDIRLTPSRFDGGRNFANKIWNSYRFLRSHIDRLDEKPMIENPFDLPEDAPLPDRWIVSRLSAVTEKIIENAEKYRLNDCMTGLYDFVWKEYCDWYLELIKVRLTPDTPGDVKRQTLSLAVAVYEAALRLLHPGMPFITEQLWQDLREFYPDNLPPQLETSPNGQPFAPSLMWAPFPKADDFTRDEEIERDFEIFSRNVESTRTIKSEHQIPPRAAIEVIISGSDELTRDVINRNEELFSVLTGSSSIIFSEDIPKMAYTGINRFCAVHVIAKIDTEAERKRFNKEIQHYKGLIKGVEAKLSNEKFLSKAPEQVIANEKVKLKSLHDKLTEAEEKIEMLS